jgi:hypothetical protein
VRLFFRERSLAGAVLLDGEQLQLGQLLRPFFHKKFEILGNERAIDIPPQTSITGSGAERKGHKCCLSVLSQL